jgi:hypothetical protein
MKTALKKNRSEKRYLKDFRNATLFFSGGRAIRGPSARLKD